MLRTVSVTSVLGKLGDLPPSAIKTSVALPTDVRIPAADAAASSSGQRGVAPLPAVPAVSLAAAVAALPPAVLGAGPSTPAAAAETMLLPAAAPPLPVAGSFAVLNHSRVGTASTEESKEEKKCTAEDERKKNLHDRFITVAEQGNLAEMNRMIAAGGKALLVARDYFVFRSAARDGRIAVVDCLLKRADSATRALMLGDKGCVAFRDAAQNGHIAIINRLWKAANAKQQAAMLEADNYAAFRGAVEKKHIGIVNRLSELASSQQKAAMLLAINYGVRGLARTLELVVRNGYADTANRLLALVRGNERTLLLANAFEKTLRYGNVATAEQLLKLANPEERVAMVVTNNYAPFRNAAKNNQVVPVNWLWRLVSSKLQAQMFAADDYAAFREAAQSGHITMVKRLLELARPEQRNELLCDAFKRKDWYEYIAIANSLWELAPPERQEREFIARNYAADRLVGEFGSAVQQGDLSKAKRFLELASDQQRAAILVNEFELAAENGRIAIVDWLWGLASHEQRAAMFTAKDYSALRRAIESHHTAIVGRIWGLAETEQKKAMMDANNGSGCYIVFVLFATDGHLAKVNRLWELMPASTSGSQIRDCIRWMLRYAFELAAENGHITTANRLLGLARDEQRMPMLVHALERRAAKHGYTAMGDRWTAIVDHLWQLMHVGKTAPILADVFESAVRNGYVAIADRIVELVGLTRRAELLAKALASAVRGGRLATIDRLWGLANPEQRIAMLTADNYEAFSVAAGNDYTAIVKRLWELAGPTQRAAMLAFNHYMVFRMAVENDYTEIVEQSWGLASHEQRAAMLAVDYAFYRVQSHRSPIVRFLTAARNAADASSERDYSKLRAIVRGAAGLAIKDYQASWLTAVNLSDAGPMPDVLKPIIRGYVVHFLDTLVNEVADTYAHNACARALEAHVD